MSAAAAGWGLGRFSQGLLHDEDKLGSRASLSFAETAHITAWDAVAAELRWSTALPSSVARSIS